MRFWGHDVSLFSNLRGLRMQQRRGVTKGRHACHRGSPVALRVATSACRGGGAAGGGDSGGAVGRLRADVRRRRRPPCPVEPVWQRQDLLTFALAVPHIIHQHVVARVRNESMPLLLLATCSAAE